MIKNIIEIENMLREMGASFIGYSDVGENLDEDLKYLSNAITIGIRLSDYTIEQIQDEPTYTYFHHYRSVNFLLDQITLRCVIKLQEIGFDAIAVPASQTVNNKPDPYCGIFPHKTAAVKAGLGWIGKSGLFVSKDFGPRVRLATILTNAELPVNVEEHKNGCNDCRLCVDACPAKAITGEHWQKGAERSLYFNAKACSEHMNKKFKHIGRGSVCGICIKVCPYGGRK